MGLTIWDLKKGDEISNKDGYLCKVMANTEDGKGLLVMYLNGDLKDNKDFLFEEEIDFDSIDR